MGIRAVLPKGWSEDQRAADQAYLEAELRKALGNPPDLRKEGLQQGIRLVLTLGVPDPRWDLGKYTFHTGVFGAIYGLSAP